LVHAESSKTTTGWAGHQNGNDADSLFQPLRNAVKPLNSDRESFAPVEPAPGHSAMNRQLVVMTLGLSLFGLGCSKVCEQKPLSGEWAKHADLVPPEATTCGGTETSLKLGFEGKSGPHSFKIMTEYIEKVGGWKEVRYGGSSMDSIYTKDGYELTFAVRDPKQPLMDVTLTKKP
jgi:hypothetical protein